MGIEAIHSPPVDLWMQMLLKRWWRDLMSYVFCVSTEDEWLMRLFFHSTLLPPWCVIVMPRGKGWGNDALHYMTGDWACFLSAAVLQRIVNHHMDGCICGSFTISLHNDHLPVKGPCESHYPWSNRRWQGKGMERTDVRWQALCFLMSVSCLQGEDSQPPFLQRIHRARKVIRPLQHHYVCWIMFSFLGKPHILIDVLLEGRPTSCTQDNIEVTGVQKKASSHVTCSVTFGYNVSVGYYLTQGLRAWHKALFWLSVHQQTLYWEVEMPFFRCKNQAPRVNTSTIMCWIVLISNVVW